MSFKELFHAVCVWRGEEGVSHFLSAQAVRVWTRTSILDPDTIVTVETVLLCR